MTSRLDGRREVFGLAAIVLLGATIRVLFLGQQVVGGDEVHTLQVLRGNSLGYILTHYHKADNCIPVTAWCWVLAKTVGLEEWGFRFWSWAPGILLVWFLPRVTRPWLSAAESLLLALVLATSPLLVYWSREARPYGPIAFLGCLALWSVVRFARDRRLRWLIASAFSQLALFALSPTTAPFLAGLGLAAAAWGWQAASGSPVAERVRGAARMFGPSLLALVLIAAVLGPALPSLLETQSSRQFARNDVGVETGVQFLRLTFGFSQGYSISTLRLLLIVPSVLTLWGIVALSKRLPAARAGLLVLLVPAVSYALSGFHMIASGMVFVRYQAVAVPLILALAVLGFARARGWLARRWPMLERPLLVGAFVLVAGHALLGPLPAGLPPNAPFGLRISRLFQGNPLDERGTAEHVPELYRRLAAERPAVVVEWPGWPVEESSYAYYQRLHRGRMVRFCRDSQGQSGGATEGLRFRTFLEDLQSIPERVPSGAVVVLHKQPEAERLHQRTGYVSESSEPDHPRLLAAARKCRRVLGPSFYEDEWLLAYRVP